MATAVQKITLSASRDIPFDKLILSQSNVRRIKAGVSIEELAEDIARRTLLQSLTVRPVRDADGAETGMYEIPAGGRRYRALELLVKQKRLAKTAPIPCVVREGGIAEEDSLAENIQRAPLHPLDQFRAFLALREKGQSEEEIAAAFFVSVAVVRQRLRLASVSPRLLEVYAEDGLTLDQLMAFTVSGDHARQEQVFERLAQSYTKEPYIIRRMLTEGAVRASDKRAQFIGLDAYEAAGGVILHDLFQSDDGGWLQDVALVDRLVAEKLEREAEAVRAEGWKWIEVAPDFAYGHTFGLRRLRGEEVPLTAEEEASRAALQAEYDRLLEDHDAVDELPEAVDRRLDEIETALAAFQDRPVRFDPAEIARAGAFVSIDGSGNLRIERGYVRPEDEIPVEPEPDAGVDHEAQRPIAAQTDTHAGAIHGEPVSAPEPEEDEGLKPIPDRLMTELTAHRTLALRHALGEQPEVAFLAALHALCLKALLSVCHGFLPRARPEERRLRRAGAGAERHRARRRASIAVTNPGWRRCRRSRPISGIRSWRSTRTAVARCSRTASRCRSTRCSSPTAAGRGRSPMPIASRRRSSSTWSPPAGRRRWTSYLGRVTKARILSAVREAKGERAAQLIDHLKKGEMAEKAEALLAGSGWLPEPLRTPGRAVSSSSGAETSAIACDETAIDGDASGHGRCRAVGRRCAQSLRNRRQRRPSSQGTSDHSTGPAGDGGPFSSRIVR